MEFRDKVAIVTGVSSGIGRQLALDLAGRGAIVVGCGRSRERMEPTLAEMKLSSPRSAVVECDVGNPDQVKAMVEKTLSGHGRVDILINNAGFGMRQPLAEAPAEVFESMMRTNYLGAVYCAQQVLPSMMKRRSGHIVNISSVAGKIGTPNMSGYCATKFALIGLTESLYHELRPFGIGVSVICPGPVRTKFHLMFDDLAPKAPSFLFLDAETVSRAVIRAIEKNRVEVVMPGWLAFACLVNRIAPNFFRWVSYRGLRRRSARRVSDGR